LHDSADWGWSEDKLAALVTRDSMIGVAFANALNPIARIA